MTRVITRERASPHALRLTRRVFSCSQDKKPRGLIPLVPKNYSASIERVSPVDQKGMSFGSSLQINLCETEEYANVLATYILADTHEAEVKAWAAEVGGAQAVPRGLGMSMAGGMTGNMGGSLVVGQQIDPAPLFKAAQAGDIRTLAQLALKMIESANGQIASLSEQVETLQRENEALQKDNELLAGAGEPEPADDADGM